MKFKVGDHVQSSPDSGDIDFMQEIWQAVIYKVKAKNDEGGCYETLGKWMPLKDEKGQKENKNSPTLRQLWGSHLVKRK
jgi:hypothetical protein